MLLEHPENSSTKLKARSRQNKNMLPIVIRPVPESKCSLLTGKVFVLDTFVGSRFGRTLLNRHTISVVIVMKNAVTPTLLYTTLSLRSHKASVIQAWQQC